MSPYIAGVLSGAIIWIPVGALLLAAAQAITEHLDRWRRSRDLNDILHRDGKRSPHYDNLDDVAPGWSDYAGDTPQDYNR